MEHRCGTRYTTDIGVYVSSRTGALSSPGRLCNVSISGGFITSALPIEPLNVVVLQLPSDFAMTRLQAQVVRRTTEGIAVEWHEYVPELVQQVLHRRMQPDPVAQAMAITMPAVSA